MIKAKVRKSKYGYKGFIQCVNGKTILWSESAGLERLTREDALDDAVRRKADREACWTDNDDHQLVH